MHFSRKRLAAELVGAALIWSSLASAKEGDELLGQPAPEWGEMVWFNATPLKLSELRGKVVLLRFWTDGCRLCERSAPALNELHEKYSGRGLVVIGFYHAKSPHPRSPDEIRLAAERLGFRFPVAIDKEWVYLKNLWLTRDRSFTSVSFLMDQEGRIRYVHPGGEFFADRDPQSAPARDYAELRRQIELLLSAAEK